MRGANLPESPPSSPQLGACWLQQLGTWKASTCDTSSIARDKDCRATLDSLATDVREAGGVAYVLCVEEPADANFTDLFVRGGYYAALLAEIMHSRNTLTIDVAQDTLKQARKLRKAFANLVEVDFFLARPSNKLIKPRKNWSWPVPAPCPRLSRMP